MFFDPIHCFEARFARALAQEDTNTMKTGRTLSAVAAVLGALSLGCSTVRTARVLGAPSPLGNGTVASYAELDESGAPKAIGVVFSAASLNSLPAAPSDGHRCFDANGDGKIDLATECSA